VHAYGHAVSEYQNSVGSAEKVVKLVSVSPHGPLSQSSDLPPERPRAYISRTNRPVVT